MSATELFDGINGRDIISGHANANRTQLIVAKPKQMGWLRGKRRAGEDRGDRTGAWLLVGACILLAGLAVAQGIVSWHAQFTYIDGIKHQHLASALEATGLDAGAVIFSVLGIALARLGRRAVIERVLVVACALGSMGMNLLSADLGSPRQVAVYGLPAVLFAAGSDRLVAVIRRAALGPAEDEDKQRSAWRAAGRGALYLLRFLVAPRSTISGARRALLRATPLGELVAAVPQAISAPPPAPGQMTPAAESSQEHPAPGDPPGPLPPAADCRPVPDPGGSEDQAADPELLLAGETKTAALLRLVAEARGPLAGFPLPHVARVAGEVAPKIGLHPGTARKALRAAVVAATDRALEQMTRDDAADEDLDGAA
jgi:hypothetical protein